MFLEALEMLLTNVRPDQGWLVTSFEIVISNVKLFFVTNYSSGDANLHTWYALTLWDDSTSIYKWGLSFNQTQR